MIVRANRRGFLRGVLATGASVGVGLPWLESVGASRARADVVAPPKRFLVWFWGNGHVPEAWVPTTTGAAWEAPPILAPLFGDPLLRPYLSLVTNARVSASFTPHGGGASGILTGTEMLHPADSNGTPGGPSIDQLIASAIEPSPGGLRSLELGVAGHFSGASGSAYNYVSHRGPDMPNEHDRDPRTVFTRLFGGRASADPFDGFRGSVLDAVHADASALSARLTARDRMRLDRHLTSVRELETRIAAAPAACSFPDDPRGRVTDAMIDTVRVGEQNLTLLNDVMSELLAMAFACDLTRVASYMYTGPAAFTRYWELASLSRDEWGQPEAIHALSHDGRVNRAEYVAGQAEAMRHFARTLTLLATTPDGEGSLLDGCAILGTSCTGEAPGHGHDDYPLIVAGTASGALRAGGVHHRFASPENASRVPLTLAHAMDVPLATFGTGAGMASAPVPELLTPV